MVWNAPLPVKAWLSWDVTVDPLIDSIFSRGHIRGCFC
jgi:hypothetical protein